MLAVRFTLNIPKMKKPLRLVGMAALGAFGFTSPLAFGLDFSVYFLILLSAVAGCVSSVLVAWALAYPLYGTAHLLVFVGSTIVCGGFSGWGCALIFDIQVFFPVAFGVILATLVSFFSIVTAGDRSDTSDTS